MREYGTKEDDLELREMILLKKLKYLFDAINRAEPLRKIDKIFYELEIGCRFPDEIDIARNLLFSKIENLKLKYDLTDEDIEAKRP